LEIARTTAYTYINDFQLTTELSAIADISCLTKEVHLRPLARLQAPERQQAIALLKDKAGQEPLTPKLLIDVAAEVIASRPAPLPKPGLNAPGNGGANANGSATEEPITPALAPFSAEPAESIAPDSNTGDPVSSATLPDMALPNQQANSTPGALAAFIDTMRRVVKKAGEVCPEHNILLAKELRDLAATLEASAKKSEESTTAT
jgi:hypothetical protein